MISSAQEVNKPQPIGHWCIKKYRRDTEAGTICWGDVVVLKSSTDPGILDSSPGKAGSLPKGESTKAIFQDVQTNNNLSKSSHSHEATLPSAFLTYCRALKKSFRKHRKLIEQRSRSENCLNRLSTHAHPQSNQPISVAARFDLNSRLARRRRSRSFQKLDEIGGDEYVPESLRAVLAKQRSEEGPADSCCNDDVEEVKDQGAVATAAAAPSQGTSSSPWICRRLLLKFWGGLGSSGASSSRHSLEDLVPTGRSPSPLPQGVGGRPISPADKCQSPDPDRRDPDPDRTTHNNPGGDLGDSRSKKKPPHLTLPRLLLQSIVDVKKRPPSSSGPGLHYCWRRKCNSLSHSFDVNNLRTSSGNKKATSSSPLSSSSSSSTSSSSAVFKSCCLVEDEEEGLGNCRKRRRRRREQRRTRSLERNHRHLVTIDSSCRYSREVGSNQVSFAFGGEGRNGIVQKKPRSPPPDSSIAPVLSNDLCLRPVNPSSEGDPNVRYHPDPVACLRRQQKNQTLGDNRQSNTSPLIPVARFDVKGSIADRTIRGLPVDLVSSGGFLSDPEDALFSSSLLKSDRGIKDRTTRIHHHHHLQKNCPKTNRTHSNVFIPQKTAMNNCSNSATIMSAAATCATSPSNNGGPQPSETASSNNSIVSKPARGWLHPDYLLAKDGINYNVRYVGCVEVNTSMKVLDFDTRSTIAKECIHRVCESSGVKATVDKRKKADKKIAKMLGGIRATEKAGSNVQLTITSLWLRLSDLDSGEAIFTHDMPNISFASGGDSDTLDFIAYVAKDRQNVRSCFVLECGGGLAQDVITTIGQAFELRFKEFLKRTPVQKPPPLQLAASRHNPHQNSGANPLHQQPQQRTNIAAHHQTKALQGGQQPSSAVPAPHPRPSLDNHHQKQQQPVDVEYYNDLPGKTPPEVAGSTLSSRRSAKESVGSNLIDLNTEIVPPTNEGSTKNPVAAAKCDPEYVNDSMAANQAQQHPSASGRPLAGPHRDPFDMSPFTTQAPGGGVFGFVDRLQEEDKGAGTTSTGGGQVIRQHQQQQQLLGEDWYHGPISRMTAEALLIHDGDFLVRESQGSPGQYVLSGMQSNSKKHLLLVDPNGIVRTKDRTFESVSHLINYHRDNSLPIISAESALRLRTPVVATDKRTVH